MRHVMKVHNKNCNGINDVFDYFLCNDVTCVSSKIYVAVVEPPIEAQFIIDYNNQITTDYVQNLNYQWGKLYRMQLTGIYANESRLNEP